MDKHEATAACAWAVAAIVAVVFVIGGPIGCTLAEDRMVVDLVKPGSHPVAAYCAIYGWDGSSSKAAVCSRLIP